MTPKFTTAELVAEAEREVMRRKREYPNRILTGRLTQYLADRQVEMMEEIAVKLRRDELELPF